MAIGASLGSLREGGWRNIVLDSGTVVVNANITRFLSSTTPVGQAFAQAILDTNTWTDPNGTVVTPKILGYTRGGSVLSLNKEERNIEVDGKRFNVKNLQRIDMMDPRLKTTLLEIADKETLQYALGSATVTTHTNFYEIRPKALVEETDYLGNITLFATINGAKDPLGNRIPIAVVFENARVNTVSDIPFVDKGEVNMPIEFVAHVLDSNPNECPMYILLPKSTADLGTSGYY